MTAARSRGGRIPTGSVTEPTTTQTAFRRPNPSGAGSFGAYHCCCGGHNAPWHCVRPRAAICAKTARRAGAWVYEMSSTLASGASPIRHAIAASHRLGFEGFRFSISVTPRCSLEESGARHPQERAFLVIVCLIRASSAGVILLFGTITSSPPILHWTLPAVHLQVHLVAVMVDGIDAVRIRQYQHEQPVGAPPRTGQIVLQHQSVGPESDDRPEVRSCGQSRRQCHRKSQLSDGLVDVASGWISQDHAAGIRA